jgi:hypothetical protein
MSVERYSARRHQQIVATARKNGRTGAEMAQIFGETQRLTSGRRSPQAELLELTRERERRDRQSPRAAAVTRPAPNKAAEHAARLQRLARAQTALGPAPRPKPLRPVYEACSSVAMAGLMFDPVTVCYAADGAAAPTGAARRINTQATHQQRLQRLANAEADMRC